MSSVSWEEVDSWRTIASTNESRSHSPRGHQLLFANEANCDAEDGMLTPRPSAATYTDLEDRRRPKTNTQSTRSQTAPNRLDVVPSAAYGARFGWSASSGGPHPTVDHPQGLPRGQSAASDQSTGGHAFTQSSYIDTRWSTQGYWWFCKTNGRWRWRWWRCDRQSQLWWSNTAQQWQWVAQPTLATASSNYSKRLATQPTQPKLRPVSYDLEIYRRWTMQETALKARAGEAGRSPEEQRVYEEQTENENDRHAAAINSNNQIPNPWADMYDDR
jgi:hypothetical protein